MFLVPSSMRFTFSSSFHAFSFLFYLFYLSCIGLDFMTHLFSFHLAILRRDRHCFELLQSFYHHGVIILMCKYNPQNCLFSPIFACKLPCYSMAYACYSTGGVKIINKFMSFKIKSKGNFVSPLKIVFK